MKNYSPKNFRNRRKTKLSKLHNALNQLALQLFAFFERLFRRAEEPSEQRRLPRNKRKNKFKHAALAASQWAGELLKKAQILLHVLLHGEKAQRYRKSSEKKIHELIKNIWEWILQLIAWIGTLLVALKKWPIRQRAKALQQRLNNFHLVIHRHFLSKLLPAFSWLVDKLPVDPAKRWLSRAQRRFYSARELCGRVAFELWEFAKLLARQLAALVKLAWVRSFYLDGKVAPPRFVLVIFWGAIVFFFLFLLWPIVTCAKGALLDHDGKLTFDYIFEVFKNELYLEGLLNALQVAFWSTLLSFAIALPLAYASHRYNFPFKTPLTALILLPLILPPFVGAFGFKQILGSQGALNTLLGHLSLLDPQHPIDWLGEFRLCGIIVLNALHLYPIFYLNIFAAMANINPALEEAAANLGCHGWRRFVKITLPLIAPGIFAGGTIVFIWAFTELGVPLMFDFTRIAPVQIFNGVKELGANPLPYALAIVVLGIAVTLYAFSRYAIGPLNYDVLGKSAGARTPSALPFKQSLLYTLLFTAVSAVALIPHLGVVSVSFSTDWYQSILPTGWTTDHYQEALGHEFTIPAIRNSLKYASAATALDLILGVLMAYVIVRTAMPARHLLDAISVLPLAIPGIVLAFGYLAMTQDGRLFSFLNPVRDPFFLLVIAYAIRRLPYVVRSAVAGFQQTGTSLEEAAQNLGAPPLRALWKITVPLISANLIAGALMAFSFAMLEVSDSLMLAQKQIDFPITKAIYELSNLLGSGPYLASALGVWSMLFLSVSLLATSMLLGKKLGSFFRI